MSIIQRSSVTGKTKTKQDRELDFVIKDIEELIELPLGRDGFDGVDGLDGAQGIPGLDGLDGVDGLDGAQGIPGVDGLDGADGLDAPTGYTPTTTADWNSDNPVSIADALDRIAAALGPII